jgi:uncharacterized repeat protein (TIGR02543 family)
LEEVSAWKLWGGKQGDTETLLAEFAGAQDTIVNLETGTWSFTINGYKDGALLLTGTIAEQTISLDATNVLNFTVAPALKEEGAISIVINLPADSGITTARVFRDGTELPVSLTPADNRIIFETPHSAGDYYFSIRLYKGADLYGVVSELVQVRANLESAKTYTLTWEDLKYTYLISYHLWEEETETAYYQYTDDTVTLPVLTSAGYVFDGWYATPALSGQALTTIPAGSTGDKDFYAKWTLVQYTVTFNADGGSPATQTQSVNSAASPIMYSSVSGGAWALQSDGRRKSPAIDHSTTAKARLRFTTTAANTSITIQLEVSSQSGSDYAFISTLDNASATYSSGYYTGSLISGTQSVSVTIPVPSPGDHFIDIGYRKDGSGVSGSDCAWFNTSSDYLLANMPLEPAKSSYTFGGWWTETGGGGARFTADTLVGADITVYAKWVEPLPSDLSLADSLTWLASNAAAGGTYTITLNADESIGPQTLSYSGNSVSITLTGDSTDRTVSLSSSGSLFTVESGVTLTLGNNVTLQGRSSNTASLVRVNSGGTLVMESGSKITGNRSSDQGGGVNVCGGTFTMSGGEISGNTANNGSLGEGGGVYVSSGTFTMNGGEISGNTASYGGGVFVLGTFTMSGGEISGNTASNYGGGVCMSGGGYSGYGTFIKESGGTIYGSDAGDALKNTAAGDTYGHAVYVSSDRKRNATAGEGITLNSSLSGSAGGWANPIPTTSLQAALTWLASNVSAGGNYTITISANESIAPQTLSYSGNMVSITLTGDSTERTVSLSSTGSLFTVSSGVTLTLGNNLTLHGMSGGNSTSLVRVNSGGTLVMESGSKIIGNRNTFAASTSSSGGVLVNGGTFTMNGGEISGNTAPDGGGGVYVSSGTFTKQSGGTIYGSDASNTLKNTASSSSYGHAVYVDSGSKKRNTTAGEGITLNSSLSGSAGGWVDPMSSNLSLADSLAWLASNAVAGGNYTITISANETVTPQTLSYSGNSVSITLTGDSTERTISLSSTGSLFTVESGVTLILGNNLTLQGRSDNTASLVQANSGGTLVMESGSKITGNNSGGVSVWGGTFMMSSGEISDNTGGVLMNGYSPTFTMSGGEISGNTGRGVFVAGANSPRFTMSDGEISGNTGGGVYVGSSSTFTMSGGEISGNTSSDTGGGVYVYSSGTFTKPWGGTIYGSDASDSLKNTATNDGHAVYVSSSKKRNRTASAGITLDTSVNGLSGGWE